MLHGTFVKLNSVECIHKIDFKYKTRNPIGTFVKIDFFEYYKNL